MEFIVKFYEHSRKQSDHRVKTWFLLGDPLPNVVIWLSYLASVKIVPRLMQRRHAFQFRRLLFIYNIMLVGLSAYIFYEFLMSAVLANYNLHCQLVDYSESELAMRMARVSWWFYVSKVIELLDTVFFMLRKKNNQVTFLHVYHHSTMIWNWWLGANYVAGGQSFFNGMVNSLVHVIMYTYYALSTFGPRIQPYLWWKRYITQLQLFQFVIVLAHTTNNLFFADDCKFPKMFDAWVFVYCISLIFLFSNFYFHAYVNRTKASKSHSNGKVE